MPKVPVSWKWGAFGMVSACYDHLMWGFKKPSGYVKIAIENDHLMDFNGIYSDLMGY